MVTITDGTRYDNSRMGDVIVVHDDGRRVDVDGSLSVQPGVSVGWSSGNSRTTAAARDMARRILEACDYADAVERGEAAA
jgi:hypothetical protein